MAARPRGNLSGRVGALDTRYRDLPRSEFHLDGSPEEFYYNPRLATMTAAKRRIAVSLDTSLDVLEARPISTGTPKRVILLRIPEDAASTTNAGSRQPYARVRSQKVSWNHMCGTSQRPGPTRPDLTPLFRAN